MKVSLQKNIAGILGTLIIHVAIINVFLIIRITASPYSKEKEIVIDFSEEKEAYSEEKTDVEEDDFYDWYAQQQFSNLAVNVEKLNEEISTEKYIEQLQQDLNEGREEIEMPELKEESITAETNNQNKNNQKSYSGPTRVHWKLNGRKGNVPAPVYRCKGRGFVKVNIEVNQMGTVVNALVDEGRSKASACHYNEALAYAKKSMFNPDINAPSKQKGWITYMFEAQ